MSAAAATATAGGVFRLEVIATWNRARACKLHMPRHVNQTPMFMPVGTQGTIKGLTTEQLKELDCDTILGNTYHLGHRPGGDVMEKLGGLHEFMKWDRNILTDSGGFQMVSLLKLAEITEEGVNFQSPHDGSMMLLTPEHSMKIQGQIGSDIVMALDDVVSSKVSGPRVEEAMYRSIRWLDRCIATIDPRQFLFAIVQGGLDDNLRKICLAEMKKRTAPGFAIGGLSGGESKDKFWRMVSICTKKPHGLPDDKPRYLMGVGYAVDLVVCSALGVDMFDCVFPTRTARFGSALLDIPGGSIQLKSPQHANDSGPIDVECGCKICKTYSRAALHAMMSAREQTGCQLITYHNIAYQMRLMSGIRNSIISGAFPQFVQAFMSRHYPNATYPVWVKEALHDAGMDLV
eukprot:TRINITY_DN1109_c1_g1_i1.p1 TRINITY_DN1109_c1_g1~~TRINITY_DN1109_c1_g1_i1.p1  ORF type:complete len:403 (+),score=68.71 TRINITY_DN1109_c1_g1_i1:193-1401(+)